MLSLSDRLRQFRELSRLFFGRFLDNDLICVDGDTRGTLIGILSLLISPGVFIPFLQYIQYASYPLGRLSWYMRDLAALPDKVLHIAFSMTVIGVLTVLEWEALLPDRRDVAVLRPFPIGLATLFSAKIWALFLFWGVFTLALDVVPGVFFPMAIVQNAPLATLGWYIRCHAIALLAGNAFIFVAMIAVQGLLITVLGWARFRRFAAYAQFVLIVAILCAFFLSLGLSYRLRPGLPPARLVACLPAFWFLGLEQVELGWSKPLFDVLAGYSWRAIGIAAVSAVVAYVLSYHRSVARCFEEQDGRAMRPGWIAGVLEATANRFIVRTPSERAAFYFVWHTATRSRSHRMLLSAWVAAGFALVFQGIAGAMASGARAWWQTPMGPLLPAPIVLSLFAITGLRFAFTVPSDLRANWIFQAAGSGDAAEYLAGARKAALLLGLAPLFVVLAPVHIALWGWVTGGLHVVFGAVIAWLLLEALLAGLDKIPFTCSYVPGKANLKTCWTFYVFGYIVYVSGLTWLDLKILQQPIWFLGVPVLAAAVRWGIEYYRRHDREFGVALVFDERPAPAVQTLELQQ